MKKRCRNRADAPSYTTKHSCSTGLRDRAVTPRWRVGVKSTTHPQASKMSAPHTTPSKEHDSKQVSSPSSSLSSHRKLLQGRWTLRLRDPVTGRSVGSQQKCATARSIPGSLSDAADSTSLPATHRNSRNTEQNRAKSEIPKIRTSSQCRNSIGKGSEGGVVGTMRQAKTPTFEVSCVPSLHPKNCNTSTSLQPDSRHPASGTGFPSSLALKEATTSSSLQPNTRSTMAGSEEDIRCEPSQATSSDKTPSALHGSDIWQRKGTTTLRMVVTPELPTSSLGMASCHSSGSPAITRSVQRLPTSVKNLMEGRLSDSPPFSNSSSESENQRLNLSQPVDGFKGFSSAEIWNKPSKIACFTLHEMQKRKELRHCLSRALPYPCPQGDNKGLLCSPSVTVEKVYHSSINDSSSHTVPEKSLGTDPSNLEFSNTLKDLVNLTTVSRPSGEASTSRSSVNKSVSMFQLHGKLEVPEGHVRHSASFSQPVTQSGLPKNTTPDGPSKNNTTPTAHSSTYMTPAVPFRRDTKPADPYKTNITPPVIFGSHIKLAGPCRSNTMPAEASTNNITTTGLPRSTMISTGPYWRNATEPGPPKNQNQTTPAKPSKQRNEPVTQNIPAINFKNHNIGGSSNNQNTPAKPSMNQNTPAKPSMKQNSTIKPPMNQNTPARPSMNQNTPGKPSMNQNTPTKPSMNQNTPTKPSMNQNTPTKPSMNQNTPTKPSMNQNTPTKPFMNQNTATRPFMNQNTPTRPSMKNTPARPSKNPNTRTLSGPENQNTSTEPSKNNNKPCGPFNCQNTSPGPSMNKNIPARHSKNHRTPAESSKNQRTMAESSKNQRTLAESSKNHRTLAESSKNQRTLAESSKNQRTLAESFKNQIIPAEPSINQNKTGGDSKIQNTPTILSKHQNTPAGPSMNQNAPPEPSRNHNTHAPAEVTQKHSGLAAKSLNPETCRGLPEQFMSPGEYSKEIMSGMPVKVVIKRHRKEALTTHKVSVQSSTDARKPVSVTSITSVRSDSEPIEPVKSTDSRAPAPSSVAPAATSRDLMQPRSVLNKLSSPTMPLLQPSLCAEYSVSPEVLSMPPLKAVTSAKPSIALVTPITSLVNPLPSCSTLDKFSSPTISALQPPVCVGHSVKPEVLPKHPLKPPKLAKPLVRSPTQHIFPSQNPQVVNGTVTKGLKVTQLVRKPSHSLNSAGAAEMISPQLQFGDRTNSKTLHESEGKSIQSSLMSCPATAATALQMEKETSSKLLPVVMSSPAPCTSKELHPVTCLPLSQEHLAAPYRTKLHAASLEFLPGIRESFRCVKEGQNFNTSAKEELLGRVSHKMSQDEYHSVMPMKNKEGTNMTLPRNIKAGNQVPPPNTQKQKATLQEGCEVREEAAPIGQRVSEQQSLVRKRKHNCDSESAGLGSLPISHHASSLEHKSSPKRKRSYNPNILRKDNKNKNSLQNEDGPLLVNSRESQGTVLPSQRSCTIQKTSAFHECKKGCKTGGEKHLQLKDKDSGRTREEAMAEVGMKISQSQHHSPSVKQTTPSRAGSPEPHDIISTMPEVHERHRGIVLSPKVIIVRINDKVIKNATRKAEEAQFKKVKARKAVRKRDVRLRNADKLDIWKTKAKCIQDERNENKPCLSTSTSSSILTNTGSLNGPKTTEKDPCVHKGKNKDCALDNKGIFISQKLEAEIPYKLTTQPRLGLSIKKKAAGTWVVDTLFNKLQLDQETMQCTASPESQTSGNIQLATPPPTQLMEPEHPTPGNIMTFLPRLSQALKSLPMSRSKITKNQQCKLHHLPDTSPLLSPAKLHNYDISREAAMNKSCNTATESDGKAADKDPQPSSCQPVSSEKDKDLEDFDIREKAVTYCGVKRRKGKREEYSEKDERVNQQIPQDGRIYGKQNKLEGKEDKEQCHQMKQKMVGKQGQCIEGRVVKKSNKQPPQEGKVVEKQRQQMEQGVNVEPNQVEERVIQKQSQQVEEVDGKKSEVEGRVARKQNQQMEGNMDERQNQVKVGVARKQCQQVEEIMDGKSQKVEGRVIKKQNKQKLQKGRLDSKQSQQVEGKVDGKQSQMEERLESKQNQHVEAKMDGKQSQVEGRVVKKLNKEEKMCPSVQRETRNMNKDSQIHNNQINTSKRKRRQSIPEKRKEERSEETPTHQSKRTQFDHTNTKRNTHLPTQTLHTDLTQPYTGHIYMGTVPNCKQTHTNSTYTPIRHIHMDVNPTYTNINMAQVNTDMHTHMNCLHMYTNTPRGHVNLPYAYINTPHMHMNTLYTHNPYIHMSQTCAHTSLTYTHINTPSIYMKTPETHTQRSHTHAYMSTPKIHMNIPDMYRDPQYTHKAATVRFTPSRIHRNFSHIQMGTADMYMKTPHKYTHPHNTPSTTVRPTPSIMQAKVDKYRLHSYRLHRARLLTART
ncbi:protein piccolo-like [Scylla paramamosain]|uniref:protein piccolo-like n=1 Tax=Scylla paramamosain TaxID=85552 RepID=UPI0030829A1C